MTAGKRAGARSLADRFWTRVQKGDGCWEWQGHRMAKGYGQIGVGRSGIDRRLVLTHRLAWELTNGPIPDGLFVCHHCDNPPCCRPDHLFLGTVADNSRDMASKGRAYGPAGMDNRNAKLTAEQVAEIRRRYVPGINRWHPSNRRELAAEFGIGSRYVIALVRGDWRRSA